MRAQRLLLRSLGLDLQAQPLELIYGYSMGALQARVRNGTAALPPPSRTATHRYTPLQAYEWATAFPDDVRRIAAVCGASRCGELNAVFLRSLEAALTADSAWDDAAARFCGTPQRGLLAFSTIYAGWGVGSEWYLKKRYRAAGFDSADAFVSQSYVPAFTGCDADDLLAQIHAWRAADVARADGGDLARALGRVKAKVLLMPCDTDRYFTVEEAETEAALLGERCTLAPIRSAAGHRAGDPHRAELAEELAFIQRHVHALLKD